MDRNSGSERKDKIFDRILKENADAIFMPLIQQELDIKMKSYKMLPSELPRTIGRRADFLCLVVTEDGEKFILHVEFQTKDEFKMLLRISEYHGIIYRKYGLPIRHVVVFLGEGAAKMRTQLTQKEVFTGFDLINTNELHTETLLSSQVPEVILLALLSDYKKDRAEAVLRLVAQRLKAVANSKADLKKYVEQLILLSKLRKLSGIANKIVKDMPVTYDYEQDYYYKIGREKEREIANQEIEQANQKIEQVNQEIEQAHQEIEQVNQEIKQEREKAKQEKIFAIKSLLLTGNLSVGEIARIMNVTEEFIASISEE